MSIETGENRMFVTGAFLYPQTSAPQDGVLREGTASAEFSRVVMRRSGKSLLDSVCHTRPTPEEIAELAESTVRANGVGWTVETLQWRPRSARPIAAPATSAAAGASDPSDSLAIGVPSAAAIAREAAAARASAAQAAEAERKAQERREDAAQLLVANEKALAAAAEQTRRIEAEKQAAADRLAQFEIEQQAYAKVKAEYQAGVAAAEAARRQWEADVASCRAGDFSRCGPVQ